MRTTYRKNLLGELTVTEASTYASFYGFCCNISVATYTTNQFLGIRFEFHPAYSEGMKIPGCSSTNNVRISKGEGGSRRYIDQEISLKDLIVEVLPFRQITEANEGVAQEICQGILRFYGGLVEYVRLSILLSLASSIREVYAAEMDNRFGKFAEKTIRNLLSSLNWPLLLEECKAPDVFKNVIDYTLTHNFPVYYPLLSEGNKDAVDVEFNETSTVDIALARIENEIDRAVDNQRRDELQVEYRLQTAKRDERQRKANEKAELLLKLVCGSFKYEEYCLLGYITIEQDGWSFRIAPRAWVYCQDPKGEHAELCIHTANLSCNPIDEMVIAYLHIKHRMGDYLTIAIPHSATVGFSVEQFKKKVVKKRKKKNEVENA